MRLGLAAILLTGVVATGACLGEDGEVARWVGAQAPAFQYLGAWQADGEDFYTIYPGSQIRFALRGTARVVLSTGLPDSVRVSVRKNGRSVVSCLAGQQVIDLDGGESGAVFSVVHLAARQTGFDPSLPEAAGAELHFRGLELGEGGELQPPPEIRNDLRVDFIGDSITAGACIRGTSGEWQVDSDAELSYAFRLAEKWGVRYRIRALCGENLDEVVPKIPFFRKGMALPINEVPDVVFINLGANDRSKDDAQYRSGMERLLDAVFQSEPEARVVLLNFHRMTPNRWPILQSLVRSRSHEKILCFDARPYLVGYRDGGVHPDAESHRLLAEALNAFVRQKGLWVPRSIGPAEAGWAPAPVAQ